MKEVTIVSVEPVTGIERQELDLRSLRQMRGLFHYESTIANPDLDGQGWEDTPRGTRRGRRTPGGQRPLRLGETSRRLGKGRPNWGKRCLC